MFACCETWDGGPYISPYCRPGGVGKKGPIFACWGAFNWDGGSYVFPYCRPGGGGMAKEISLQSSLLEFDGMSDVLSDEFEFGLASRFGLNLTWFSVPFRSNSTSSGLGLYSRRNRCRVSDRVCRMGYVKSPKRDGGSYVSPCCRRVGGERWRKVPCYLAEATLPSLFMSGYLTVLTVLSWWNRMPCIGSAGP